MILCIEALMTCLQKSSNTWNLSSALQITFHFMRKNIFHVLYFKLQLATLTHWERKFQHPCRARALLLKLHLQLSLTEKEAFSIRGLAFSICLVALNTALVFLEALSWFFELKKHFISWERNIFMYLSFIHKIALSNFLSLRKKFSASVTLHSLHLLSCTKHSISVLRSSKLVILCIEALTWLASAKSSNTWKSVFCNANNI